MKFGSITLSGFLFFTSEINAFTLQQNNIGNVVTSISSASQNHGNRYMSLSPLEEAKSTNEKKDRTGRSQAEIHNELSSGRVLEEGPVIDFGSIKDISSRSERALSQARVDYQAAIKEQGKDAIKLGFAGEDRQRLMGINDEVVQEVGREVGAFVNDDKIVQRCAAHLRARAPNSLRVTLKQPLHRMET